MSAIRAIRPVQPIAPIEVDIRDPECAGYGCERDCHSQECVDRWMRGEGHTVRERDYEAEAIDDAKATWRDR